MPVTREELTAILNIQDDMDKKLAAVERALRAQDLEGVAYGLCGPSDTSELPQ